MLKLPSPLAALACAALALAAGRAQAQTAPFSQFIIFGDSLSDTGNDGHVSKAKYGLTFPGQDFNYTTGRFTSGKDTSPASKTFGGVWHEQLAKIFLGLPAVANSLDGGLDYAYGGATTDDGTRDLSMSLGGTDVSLTINNMGQQVSDYLNSHSPDPAALFIVWGGANDLFDTPTGTGYSTVALAAADRETALINRLAQAGAKTFLVPNLPPLGATPAYNTNAVASAGITQASSDFRDRLNADLDALQASLTGQGLTVTIYRLDVYALFGRLLANQAAYNFYDILHSAQGQSVKADNQLFWDDVHPTAAGHYQLAVEAFTTLTGTPVVQVNPDFTADGFFVTRSGTDVSADLRAAYAATGTAVAGTDYTALKGARKIKAGKFTAKVAVPPFNAKTSAGKTVVLTLQPMDAYALGKVTAARIKFNNPIQPAASAAVSIEGDRSFHFLDTLVARPAAR